MTNKSSQNYLLQHSAGSGKTNEIAWLSYRLASLHDDNNKIIFDSIIICTDRVVVDRQLQQAVLSLEHKSGSSALWMKNAHLQTLAGRWKVIRRLL